MTFAGQIDNTWEVNDLRKQIKKLERQNRILKIASLKNEEYRVFYEAMSKQNNDAFFVHDSEGRILEANEQAHLKLGYTGDELKGMLVSDIEMDIDLERSKIKWQMTNPGENFKSKGHNRRKDGTIFPVEVQFSCALSGNKKVFLGFVKDITDRFIAEEEKRLSNKKIEEIEAKFQNVFEASNAGKSLTMVSGEMYVNEAFAQMLGYEREELQMKSWKEITPAEDIEPIEKILATAYGNNQNKGIRVVKRYIRKDGSLIWTDVSGKLVKDENGKGLYHIATIIDITDRIKAEEALEKVNNDLENKVKERTSQLEMLNKELQAFNYSVSHDLRAPLRVLRTYAGILEDDFSSKLDDRGKKYIHNINKSADRMETLINDLLNLSQVSRSELRFEEVDMNEIAESIYYELASDEERMNFKFVLSNLQPAYCDSSLIQQVWQNLICNALKYSSKSETKKIEIYCSESRNEVTYNIKDQGSGFDDKYSKKLFNPFQRLHKTDEFPGSGIGLAIVQQIISRHGGSVNAQCTPEEGTIFSFTLKKHKQIKTPVKTIKQYP